MNFKVINLGNTKKDEFDISQLNANTWQAIAEDIVAVTISPRVVNQNTTNVKIVVRDNVAKIGISYKNGSNVVVAKLTLNQFGCAKDNYVGDVSQILQLCMKDQFGVNYSKALTEKQSNLTL